MRKIADIMVDDIVTVHTVEDVNGKTHQNSFTAKVQYTTKEFGRITVHFWSSADLFIFEHGDDILTDGQNKVGRID